MKNLFSALFCLFLMTSTYAQNTIKVNSADNELYIIAVSDKANASYEICHLKQGWFRGVNVTLNITAGTFTRGYMADGHNKDGNGANDITGSMNVRLPAGNYAILIATIDWGTKGYSSVTVNGTTYTEDIVNGKDFNPLVRFKAGDEGNPIMITVK